MFGVVLLIVLTAEAVQSSSAAIWKWRHRDLDPLRCLYNNNGNNNKNKNAISVFIVMKFSLSEIKMNESFLECMRFRWGLRIPLSSFSGCFFVCYWYLPKLTQTCQFPWIITWCLAYFSIAWFMSQISSRQVNAVKLRAPPYCHQLSKRWVAILQASENSCLKSPQGMQLPLYNLEAHFLPMLYENLPEIKRHVYFLFLFLEVPHQSSSSELVAYSIKSR